jgi:hypothetical protein
VLIATTVLAVHLSRATKPNTEDAEPAGVANLLALLADHAAAARDFSDDDIAATATAMAQLAGEEPGGGTLRRNRKAVTKLISQATTTKAGAAAKATDSKVGEPARTRGAH